MKRKFNTILCIIIVLLGVLHFFVKSPIIVTAVGVLFAILIGSAFFEAVKEKEKWRTFCLIGFTIVFGFIILNYLKVI
ncbi:hypothetical protein GJU41_00180 [Bacillus idriensis]|uniref:DUF3953 domain-containing protein n=1 Tax=Metabacillus idriensis TaxID=324768 RepID=A0A6I2M4Q7_9BACI|nr:hypothetical protein [Metabacillus idriensis]MRX52372.1 hypothetical protein [Metabacillus idriensis]